MQGSRVGFVLKEKLRCKSQLNHLPPVATWRVVPALHSFPSARILCLHPLPLTFVVPHTPGWLLPCPMMLRHMNGRGQWDVSRYHAGRAWDVCAQMGVWSHHENVPTLWLAQDNDHLGPAIRWAARATLSCLGSLGHRAGLSQKDAFAPTTPTERLCLEWKGWLLLAIERFKIDN